MVKKRTPSTKEEDETNSQEGGCLPKNLGISVCLKSDHPCEGGYIVRMDESYTPVTRAEKFGNYVTDISVHLDLNGQSIQEQ